MAFVPYVMTKTGPRVVYPLERIVEKQPIQQTNVSSMKELEDTLLKHIDERFQQVEQKLTSSSNININIKELQDNLRREIKDEIKDFLCSDCIKQGTYDIDKKQI